MFDFFQQILCDYQCPFDTLQEPPYENCGESEDMHMK